MVTMPVDTDKVREWAAAVTGWFNSGMAITTMTVAGNLAPLAREAANELDALRTERAALRAALAAVPHAELCRLLMVRDAEPCSCAKSTVINP